MWRDCHCECPHSVTAAVNDLLGIKSGFNKRKVRYLDIRYVRAAFVVRGDSLHAWARRNGYSPTHVLRSIRADYRGPKAKRVVDELRCELAM